jgi:hypothetical protein
VGRTLPPPPHPGTLPSTWDCVMTAKQFLELAKKHKAQMVDLADEEGLIE